MRVSYLLWLFISWVDVKISSQQNVPSHCGRPPPLENGDTAGTTQERYNQYDRVEYVCQRYYTMEGGPHKICIDGQWAGEVRCLKITCEKPVIENGFVVGDIKEYRKREVLDYRCNPQYKRDEERASRCTIVGLRAEWSPTPLCEHVTCKVRLPPLTGTQYEPYGRSVFSPGDRLRVICGDKYFISDQRKASAEILCKDNGSWEHRPLCQEITCSHPRDPLLDFWVGGWYQNKAGETAPYTCISGYKRPNGVDEATCTRDGWTPNPLCQEVTCKRMDYQNAVIDGNVQQVYKYNDQVRYTCKSDRDRYYTLTCTEQGLWRGTIHCPDMSCSTPDMKDAVIMENDGRVSYRHGERVAFRCSHGVREVFIVTCEQGEWTRSKTCSGCGKLHVEHGFGVHPNVTVPLAYYTCNEGYKLFTKGWWAEAKCNEGAWSKTDTCIEQRLCGKEPVIPNGKATRRGTRQGLAQTVQITCDPGYTALLTQLNCQEGQWNFEGLSPEKICQRNDDLCGPPPKVENAVVTTSYQKEYLSDSEVTYQCCDQHKIGGEDTIRCEGGEWEKKDIKCIHPSYCGRPPSLEDGDTAGTTQERYNRYDRVEYVCQTYYTMEGGPYKICIDGQWTGDIRCLKPCMVDRDAMTQRNIRFRFTRQNKVYFTHKDAAEFVCTRGRPVGGVAMRQRCLHGVMNLPTCA